MSCVDDIPVANTPPGGHDRFPPPVLAGCDQPIVDGAPDLRGVFGPPDLDPVRIEELS